MERSRRSVLQSGAGALALGAAGCLSAPDDGTGPEGGYAAFFPLWDWAQHVSGDQLSFETPVETGQLGHGWEPTGNLTADIADSEIFVYLDSPEFAWAQNVATTLESDYEHVTLVDGMAGLEDRLLSLDEGDHDHAHGDESEHDGHGHDDGAHGDENDSHDHGNGDDDHNHDHEDDGHDHDDSRDHEDDAHEDGNTSEFYDPHVWTDPVLARNIVETIADGLTRADPDNESTYRENAAAYSDRLAAVDEQLESLVSEADRDVAVLAGHDSFRYLEDRYGFELHTPATVSPDAQTTSGDLADTIDLIDEHGMETILYDPFEATGGTDLPQEVEHLLENSHASAAEPISSLEGTTATWDDRGWGWLEQLTELNIPSLRAALGAA